MERRTFISTVMAGLAASAFSNTLSADANIMSPAAFDLRMKWWREARFGMFIHWGIYAVLGLGEWAMYTHRIPEKSYQRLAKHFSASLFDADEWASLAERAGMKYMVITSKHHDGFSMYDSKLTQYDVVDATPFGRDPLRELAEACSRHKVRFGFYYSILDAHYSGLSSFRRMKNEGFEKYERFLYGQLTELLSNYGPIGSVFLDGEWIPQWSHDKGLALEKHIRSLQPNVILNDRAGREYGGMGDYETPEQFIPDSPFIRPWETCMTINHSWGYHRFDKVWKSPKDLVRKLVDIVSKDGNFLLNVGPDREGRIPRPSIKRLERMGEWMQINGDSIYKCGPGPVEPGKWGRSTAKQGRAFLHFFEWPSGEYLIKSPGLSISKAFLLADPRKESLPLRRTDAGIIIKLPETCPDPLCSTVALETP